jgi:lipoate-protein ligase A
MTSADGTWQRHDWQGTAADFHSLEPSSERGLWWCNVDAPALIVGSSQSVDTVRSVCAAENGIDVVRRRSGGGIVYVHPSDSVWIDITISREDPLWVDDVSSSMLWLGGVFVDALSPWLTTSVYTDAFSAGEFGREICFVSHSPGEVFAGDAKVVGISQRRTRDGARFQCVLYRQWNPSEWTPCIDARAAADAASSLRVATVAATADQIVTAVHNALPL